MPKDKIVLVFVQDYCLDCWQEYVDEECNVPLGILYLGTHLYNHGFKVTLLDTRLETKDNFLKLLDQELAGAFLAGFSVTTPVIKEAVALSRYVKEKDPRVQTVWGGAHPSLFPESTIANEYIDYVIIKDGEEGLLALANYSLHRTGALADSTNLFYKNGSAIARGRQQEKSQVTGVGVCRYDLLPIKRYIVRKTEEGVIRRQLEVLASRGCPHHCRFCINTVLYHNRWHGYPMEEVLKTVDSAIKEYGITHIFFMDEDFFCNRKRAEEFIHELTKRMITWESNCRADYISPSYIDDSFLKAIKESGCVKLRMGLESGSPVVLNSLTKGITVKQSIQAVRRLTNAGILPSVSFMMGVPGETAGDVLKTLSLILKLQFINPRLQLIGPLLFRPYPGSDLFQECLQRGLKQPQGLSEWSDFYIHQELEQYTGGFPWFKEAGIFKRVWIFVAHLSYMRARLSAKVFVYCVLKIHLLTRLRFIGINYLFYKLARKTRALFARLSSNSLPPR